jgi:SagB-type dehydrogenase family enzyme
MENHIGKEFIERTKYNYLTTSDQQQGLPQPPLEADYDQSVPLIDLPSPQEFKLPDISLKVAMDNRRSVRAYGQAPISLQELSYLLWYSQGVQEVLERGVTLRPVPSAGARHALETLLLVNNVDGLKSGLYRYVALKHKLIQLNVEEDIADDIVAGSLGQRFLATSAVTFIWVADMYRMTYRYSERGYRYIFLDAGHACQNLYLAAEAIGCGACAVAAFDDNELNSFLALDGLNQFAVYIAPVGKKKKNI